jgi:hypothetical protein
MYSDSFVDGPNMSTEPPVGEGTGASVRLVEVLGQELAEAERFDCDHLAELAGRGGAYVEGHVRHLDVA